MTPSFTISTQSVAWYSHNVLTGGTLVVPVSATGVIRNTIDANEALDSLRLAIDQFRTLRQDNVVLMHDFIIVTFLNTFLVMVQNRGTHLVGQVLEPDQLEKRTRDGVAIAAHPGSLAHMRELLGATTQLFLRRVARDFRRRALLDPDFHHDVAEVDENE